VTGKGRAGLVASVVALLVAAPLAASAQVSCTYNGTNGNCQTASNNTNVIRLTVTAATRLSMASTTITLPVPSATDFESGVGTGIGFDLVMKANVPWTLTFRALNATWTGTGSFARLDRPVGDLQRATALAGPYVDVVTTSTTLSTGAASAGTNLTMYFRAKYAWLLDGPGTYTLPLELTITSP